MPWKCFLTEPSDFCRRSLRRYSGNDCPATKWKYHNVEVIIDPEVPVATVDEGSVCDPGDFEGDPRWPKVCECGYRFHPEDHWQVNLSRLYRGSPDGKLYIPRELPPGGMWDAWWLVDHEGGRSRWAGSDGRGWCLMMPGGIEWIVYGPSTSGAKWQVTGTPPNITASPSVNLVGVYHGHVVGGVVSADVEGRRFPAWPSTA